MAPQAWIAVRRLERRASPIAGRRPARRLSVAIGVAVAFAPGVALGALAASDSPSRAAPHSLAPAYWPQPPYPPGSAVDDAARFAASRPGRVSFALAEPNGRVRGFDADSAHSSASASKALLLAAELWRLRGEVLDRTTRVTLKGMITRSDNEAANLIYGRVGDSRLTEAARRARMREFSAVPGYWGGAQVTAADLARFYIRLGANLPASHRRFGRRLLAGVVPEQRWGLPVAAGGRWAVWFKGGWRPPEAEETSGPVTHQAGLLRHRRHGARVAIAVLTDSVPGSTAFATIEGIAERLVASPPPAPPRWPAL